MNCNHETVVCATCGEVIGAEPTVADERASERAERIHDRIAAIRQGLAERSATRTASVRSSDARLPVDRNGPLRVTCWCEAAVVTVPAAEVRAGRTRSCRRSDCSAPSAPDGRARGCDVP